MDIDPTVAVIAGTIALIALLAYSAWDDMRSERLKSRTEYRQEAAATAAARQALELAQQQLTAELQEAQQAFDVSRQELRGLARAAAEQEEARRRHFLNDCAILTRELSSGFPWLAAAIADYRSLQLKKTASALETKAHPAPRAAETVRQCAALLRDADAKAREAAYLLEYYHALFPWLEDVAGEDYAELVRWLHDEASPQPDIAAEEEDPVRHYLAPHEYWRLSEAERNQLALDRYVSGRKSKWQIGRDYELFIGSRYESDGWKVKYFGTLERFQDFGRDLIVQRGKTHEVIQCKNWAQDKLIHEKHVFQLFGTLTAYKLDLPSDESVTGRLIVSNQLSEQARVFARVLQVEYVEGLQLTAFSRIKCNVSRTTQEKIYHLPFDPMYDHTMVEPKRGERYALTVNEAEAMGFRRAWRWSGN